MKIRNGFVSNSSSSSYIVCEDLTSIGLRCFRIPAKHLDAVSHWLIVSRIFEDPVTELDPNKEWYVTRFVTEYERDETIYDKLKEIGAVAYCNGQMDGVPYDWCDDDPYTVCVAQGDDEYDSVYMRREHTDACEMTVDELPEYLRSKYPEATKFVVLPGENNETITPVYGGSDD